MVGDEGPVQGTETNAGLARTQSVAALVIVILITATVWVALSLDDEADLIKRSTWAYEMTQIDQAWELGHRGQGVRVGIVDTGIDTGHPALRGVSVVAWRDLVNGIERPYDDVGHGTAMASIIAGRDPIRGGATDADLVVVKVMDRGQPFSDVIIADGIDFCMDPDGDDDPSDGVDIISLSLGGEYDDIDIHLGTRTQAAITQAVSMGIIVVAAAGNDGGADDVTLPGRIPEVISVAAVDSRGDMAPFSSPGNASVDRPDPNRKPEVNAPGVDITTAYRDDLYVKGSGTSQAAAFTTAAIAVALSAAPTTMRGGPGGGNVTTVMRVKTALAETALPLDGQTTPHDGKAGYGLVQALDLAMTLKT